MTSFSLKTPASRKRGGTAFSSAEQPFHRRNSFFIGGTAFSSAEQLFHRII
jgi:hypothetical protein